MRICLVLSLAFTAHSEEKRAPFPPFPGPWSKGGPDVTFEQSAVVASNVRLGATVYFSSLAVSSPDHRLIIDRPAAVLADSDRDGVVRFPTTVQTRSLWLVVDGASGGYTVSAPVGFLLRFFDVDGKVVRGGPDNALRRILSERNHVDIFLVRPGFGMWSASVKDGHDEDREINGSLIADLASFRPLGSNAAVPDRLKSGDILLIIDRNTFEFFVTRRKNDNGDDD